MSILATHCPFCGAKLDEWIGVYGTTHKADDHEYDNTYDPDTGYSEKLTINGITYHQNDVARVCKLKAFT